VYAIKLQKIAKNIRRLKGNFFYLYAFMHLYNTYVLIAQLLYYYYFKIPSLTSMVHYAPS